MAKLSKKIKEFFEKGGKSTLKAVIIKGKGAGYYYDMVEKTFIMVKKRSEMYYLPMEEDEKGRICLFVPYVSGSVVIILVPKEDVIFIGDN